MVPCFHHKGGFFLPFLMALFFRRSRHPMVRRNVCCAFCASGLGAGTMPTSLK